MTSKVALSLYMWMAGKLSEVLVITFHCDCPPVPYSINKSGYIRSSQEAQ